MSPTNPVVEAIMARRSVRTGYDRARPVPRELLEVVTACGLAAPSSKNAKPWRLHVVSSPALLDELAAVIESAPGLESYVPHDPATGRPHEHWASTVLESAAVLRSVPAAIFVENRGVFSGGKVGLLAANPEALAGAITSYGFECTGLGTAVENMWIAAGSLGLSASFVGDVAIAEDVIRARLGLCGDLVGVLALGYSATGPLPARPSPVSTQVDHPVVWH